MNPRHIVIKYATPLVWKAFEARKLAALQDFSDTELDSGWQSIYTFSKISDPKTKAELLMHALDEFYHADLFNNLLHSYASSPLHRPIFSRKTILDEDVSKASILDFLAQVFVGEHEINRDFKIYSEANIDPSIRTLFQNIKRDEEGHEEVSWDLMLRYADGNVLKLRCLLLYNRLKLAFARYEKFSQLIGDKMLSVLLSGIYFLGGALFSVSIRSRLKLDRAAQLEIFREQMKAFHSAGAEN
jgi:hypothetical protein